MAKQLRAGFQEKCWRKANLPIRARTLLPVLLLISIIVNSIAITTPIVTASSKLAPPEVYVAAMVSVIVILPAPSRVNVAPNQTVRVAISAFPILAVAVPLAIVFRNVIVPVRYLEHEAVERLSVCS